MVGFFRSVWVWCAHEMVLCAIDYRSRQELCEFIPGVQLYKLDQ